MTNAEVAISSEKLNVYMFRDVDCRGCVFCMVQYGFDQKTFSSFKAALTYYRTCYEHSREVLRWVTDGL